VSSVGPLDSDSESESESVSELESEGTPLAF
jgi:hypothetical protein